MFIDNHVRGGVDVFLKTLLPQLRQNGLEVRLTINGNYPGMKDLLDVTGENVILDTYSSPLNTRWFTGIGRRHQSGARLKYHNLLVWILEQALLAFEIGRLKLRFRTLREERILVVNGGYPGSSICRAMALATGKNNQLYMNIHGLATPRLVGVGLVEKVIDQIICKRTTSFICVSETCGRRLRVRLGTNDSRVDVIQNAIKPFDRDQITGSLPRVLGDKTIGLIGTLEQGKGQFFALEVLAEVKALMGPDTPRLLLFGSDPYGIQNVLLEYAGRLDVTSHVSYMGMFDDRAAMYSAIDLILIPSLTAESFSLVAAEASYFGLPIVASDAGALPETLAGVSTAVVVDHRDTRSWASILVSLLTNDTAATQNVLSVGRYARMFDPAAMAKEYVNLLFEESLT